MRGFSGGTKIESMPTIEELQDSRISEALLATVEKRVLATVTSRCQDADTCRSALLLSQPQSKADDLSSQQVCYRWAGVNALLHDCDFGKPRPIRCGQILLPATRDTQPFFPNLKAGTVR